MALCQLASSFGFSLSLAIIQSNFGSDNVRDSGLLCFTFISLKKNLCFTLLLYFRQENGSAGEILEKWYKDRLLCVQLVF